MAIRAFELQAAAKSGGAPPKAAAGAPAAGGVAAVNPTTGQPADQVVPETPLQQARNLQKKLAKSVGEAKKLLLSLRGVKVGGAVEKMIDSAATNLEKQYSALNNFITKGINDPTIFEPYRIASEKLLQYYETKRQYATALMGVQRRQQAAEAAAVGS